ncbi:sarcosine oxidase subunit gamma [Bradyrhizobium sp. RDI18]|uniref:sarcosine oxidase subunit gamma n=1 Tax=Bradyrhizobium sp. RDI18 TaxID=3367400 RepID=UPI00372118D1
MADPLIHRSNALSEWEVPYGLDRGAVSASSEAFMSALPGTGKVIFRCRRSAISAAEAALGIALPRQACRFVTFGQTTAYWLGPDEWMLQLSEEDPARIIERAQKALAGQPCSIVDVSHRSEVFAISGPRSEYVLNHACPLDLSEAAFPVSACTRTILGKASVLLSRTTAETFHVDIWRSFAPYAWQLLDEVRTEFSAAQAQ